MEVVNLKNWEEFERIVADEYSWVQKTQNEKENKYLHISDTLFRGHANKNWKLETTFERYIKKYKIDYLNFSWASYHQILNSINPFFSSFSTNNFKISSFSEDSKSKYVPPCYEFMVYVRHHGFPSPLLDWTKSPYVAAFFAFEGASEEDSVAIYMFREYNAGGKGYTVGEPIITTLGPYVQSHKRHYLQQCQYTICVTHQPDANHKYCSHEDARFSDNREDQDFIRKFLMPGSERKKVLEKLDLMNINAFSLFGTEESMLSSLAYREIEKGS